MRPSGPEFGNPNLDSSEKQPALGLQALQQGGSDQAMGRSRGGPTTKIHVIVDALGNPLALRSTGGQVHDIARAEALAAEVQPKPSSATGLQYTFGRVAAEGGCGAMRSAPKPAVSAA